MRTPVCADYDIGQWAGTGGFGKVYRGVVRQNGDQVAIKVIDRTQFDKQTIERVHNEIQIHRGLNTAVSSSYW